MRRTDIGYILNLAAGVFLTALAGGFIFSFQSGRLYEPRIAILFAEITALALLGIIGVITAFVSAKKLSAG